MSKERIALDLGRSFYKAAVANNKTIAIQSGVASISEAEYNRALERDINPGIVTWNDQYFAIGEEAGYYRLKQDATTADRYTRDNIGIVAANMIARFLGDDTAANVDVIVSHPPLDMQNTKLLKEAIIGDWNFSAAGKRYRVEIDRVMTYDEPLAILMNSMLTVEGTAYQRRPDGATLVVDLGGITADLAGTHANGRLNTAMIDSENIGVNEVVQQFGETLRARYPKIFKSVYRLDQNLLLDAFRTGTFKGGKTLDCEADAKRFRNDYLNRLMNWLRNRTGALINFNTIIYGGGGAGLFAEELLAITEHDTVLFADTNLSQIHTAGVRGMLKFANFLESKGQW